MNRRSVRRLTCLVGLVLTLLAMAPAPVAATPDTGESPATEAPDTVPVTVTTPDTVTPDGGGDDDIPWPLIIAGGAVVIAVIALIAALSRRGSSSGGTATVQPTPSAASHQHHVAQDRGYALGSAQWVHDNFTVELLAASPEAAARRWNSDRARLDDATIRAQRFSADPQHGVAWQSLAQSLSLLSASLETLIQLRNADEPDSGLIHEATDVVQRHRAQLASDIATLWPTLQS
jgi:hypothetical protein